MALVEKKILESERNSVFVKSTEGDRLVGTVENNKNVFDKYPELIRTKYNELIDLLISMGLDSVAKDLSDRYTKDETRGLVEVETRALVEDVNIDLATGAITITKKDGSSQTIDTALEKIPATFEFEVDENEDKYYLKVTNTDGTESRTEITNLMNQYTFQPSSTIAFTVTGSGTTTFVKAEILAKSITLSALAEEVTQFISQSTTQVATDRAVVESAKMEVIDASITVTDNLALSIVAKEEAVKYGIMSKSYAIGTTGSRTGEETDNSAYYSRQAAYYSRQAETYKNQAHEIAGKDIVFRSELESTYATYAFIDDNCNKAGEITIPAEGWQDDVANSGFYILTLESEAVTEDSILEINLDADSILVADDCGLKPVVTSFNGGFMIYADSVPGDAMTGSLLITGRVLPLTAPGSGGGTGTPGVGIESIEQTTLSVEDNGDNVLTITLTDGTFQNFYVQNGSKGSKGDKGDPGADGSPGKDGADATVTTANITAALGYTPAKQADVTQLSEEIVDLAVTPQMYGAVGDGVTDDTQALADALTENSAVFLPKGTYLITQPIDLTQGKSLYSYNQEGVIKYTGSESAVLLGRRSRISGVKILVSSTTVDHVFNTDNRIMPSTSFTLMTDVDDIEVYFDNVAGSFETNLINIVASNKDYSGVSGFHNQRYSNIRVAGQTRIRYGIKICVSFDAPYEAGVTGALPWITDIRFDHIWLGSPKCAIKVHRENNSGTDIAYNSIVKTEHMMFTDVAAQCTSDGHVEKFYDVEWCMAEFINCLPWDYHHITNNGKKYNVIGAGALLSEVNARRSPIDVAEFPSVTATTPEADPAYFLRTFFNFQSNIDGKYNYIDMKCEEKIGQMEIDETKVESIAQNVVEESLTGIYYNRMLDPLTRVYTEQRFSNSGQKWESTPYNDALIIPIELGTNLIRWKGNVLSDWYMTVFLSNDLASCVIIDEHPYITVTTDSGDTYLEINNSAGYAYAILPFVHTDIPMNADNMIVTVNEVIGSGAMKSVGDHLNNSDIHVTEEDKIRWNSKAGIGSKSEDWTFTLADGSTVTKKVVLV